MLELAFFNAMKKFKILGCPKTARIKDLDRSTKNIYHITSGKHTLRPNLD